MTSLINRTHFFLSWLGVLLNAVILSVCHRGVAIQSAPAPPRGMGRSGTQTEEHCSRSHVAWSRGRRLLSIADDSEAVLTAIKQVSSTVDSA